jgi:uncharacterized membrane protein (UPF0127 family)
MQETKVTFHPKKSQPVTLTCEIAKSFVEKMKGLMYRTSLPDNKGMLFPFLVPWYRGFWMKNVNIPLDIIFINRKLRVTAMHEAPVESSWFHKIYWSHGFCKYVVECNKGFCKKYGISLGAKIDIEK